MTRLMKVIVELEDGETKVTIGEDAVVEVIDWDRLRAMPTDQCVVKLVALHNLLEEWRIGGAALLGRVDALLLESVRELTGEQ